MGQDLWGPTRSHWISPAHGSGYLLGGRSYSSTSHEKSEDNINPSDHLNNSTSYTSEELNPIGQDLDEEQDYY